MDREDWPPLVVHMDEVEIAVFVPCLEIAILSSFGAMIQTGFLGAPKKDPKGSLDLES